MRETGGDHHGLSARPASGRPADPPAADPPAVDPRPVPPPYPAGSPRFAPGEVVRIRQGDGPGHIRTPWYMRGRIGRIERICGAFGNPETLAYGRESAPVPLYRVRVAMAELWAGSAEGPRDTLDVEIFEHWLEPLPILEGA